ncbi:tRNA(Ile)(2)-agmatinylcytidine synthase [Natrarchaeobius chitinivorans]|uniref:tRNA(Ile2) 2-agmatinylcytidine synthetase TiaS n=1 Tax=Natrarchaeobius chitinivorans TaxID=1679083 RepID=A0A3N6M730_NATCH|nr:tRNA(Ile)(2)-agmatinylcytidine synthase [Natrarchaeobius chitinivorans]RQG91930.1 DUF1743 domain-containing protein [Natrarchaeobius chitinivorans]
MTVVGLDDTDSREYGMCTTYVASRIAEELCGERTSSDSAGNTASISRTLLVRLNPAVEYKTRGNAALAIHTDCDPDRAFEIARGHLESLAEVGDDRTNPGLVVADHPAGGDGLAAETIPEEIGRFARRAIRDHLEIGEATELIERHGYRSWSDGDGRGLVGALAAVGSWRELEEWTYEHISYRERERWGTTRDVDLESVFDAADRGYPEAWDTVDRVEGEPVCVPHTPGPILYGIRGDGLETVRRLGREIESEPVASSRLFVTNQGTDAHLREGTIADARDGRAYRLEGQVATEPETRRGGHVFFSLAHPATTGTGDGDGAGTDRAVDTDDASSDGPRLECAAFEPTKRFRDRVRALRVGDRITACGEVSSGTLKLEKFAVRDLVRTERVTPTCSGCDRTMESAGRDQGYRCRDCETTAPGKETVPIERELEEGWYEVPPCARRHIAKPLVRGGFDTKTHLER